MGRAAALVVALLAGALLPQLGWLAFLIRWILVFMLFSGFLGMPLAQLHPRMVHLRLLLAWLVFPALGWLLLRPFGQEAAVAGLLVGATPTATAAPTITRLLGGHSGFVAFSFLGSNLLAMVALPLTLWFLEAPLPQGAGRFLAENIANVAVPLSVAALCHRAGWAVRLGRFLTPTVFPLWLGALLLALARTSAFVRSTSCPTRTLLAVGGVSGILCLAHFALGRRLGGTRWALEAGQSLGQKNTMLTLWLGLASFGPVAALGPAWYVLWHNLWNAFQMVSRSDRRSKA